MIDPREALQSGLESLRHHALRSFLTTLGVILGVASVIAMLSIGEGAKREALEKFKLLGVNNIIVRERALSDEERKEVRAKFSLGLSWRTPRRSAGSSPPSRASRPRPSSRPMPVSRKNPPGRQSWGSPRGCWRCSATR